MYIQIVNLILLIDKKKIVCSKSSKESPLLFSEFPMRRAQVLLNTSVGQEWSVQFRTLYNMNLMKFTK